MNLITFNFITIRMDSIKKLQDLFSEFPTVGRRTAGRFVFYLVNLPKEKVAELANAILELKSNTKLCNFCFNPHESDHTLCAICQNASRNRQILCIIEKETDLLSIENTKKYNGLYFILGGTLDFKQTNPGALRMQALKERMQNSEKFGLPHIDFAEIIMAVNPTPEGKATTSVLEKFLKESGFDTVKITHLAKGLPAGGELEYADEETLESAFSGRK